MANPSVPKKQFGILFLTKSGFDLDIIGLASPLKHSFTPDIIAYLEVIDEAKLQQDIKTFVEQNKIVPSDLAIVLGPDTLFESEMPTIPPSQELINMHEQFIDTVPFQNVFSKFWNINQKTRLVACNADLYYGLKNAFEQLGFTITMAIPYFLTGRITFDREIIQLLLRKHDTLKQESMVASHLMEDNLPLTKEAKEKKKNAANEKVLIGIFIALLVVLGIVVYWQFFLQAKPPATRPPRRTIVPTTKPSPVATSSASFDVGALKVQVTNVASGAATITKVTQALHTAGVDNIVVAGGTPTGLQQTMLIFKASVPQAEREQIVNILDTVFQTVSIQETGSSTFDLVISAGALKSS